MKKIILTVALCGTTAATAFAQSASSNGGDSTNELEEVTVTGTLIRGIAPTGSPTVSLDNASIVATGTTNTADLLSTVPAIVGFNTLPIGGNQEFRSTGATVPGFRGLPGTATLVMIDGHRLVGDSPLLTTADPSSIPAGAIDHIEIVEDGGSATYGSDAVAGVINIILKKNFNGIEVGGSYTGANSYNAGEFNTTMGKTWTGGSGILTFQYENNAGIRNDQRSYYTEDLRTLGTQVINGKNYGGFDGLSTTCGPALNYSVQPAGINPATGKAYTKQYYNALTGAPELGTGNITQLATCDPAAQDNLINPNRRYGLVGNAHQDIGERTHFSLDAKYTDDLSKGAYNPTTLAVNGLPPKVPGSSPAVAIPNLLTIPSTNPFYYQSPYIAATSPYYGAPEVAYANSAAFGALGSVVNQFRARSAMIDLAASYDISKSWEIAADLDYGLSSSTALNPVSTGPNPLAVYNAENGTTAGTALDPFGYGTNPAVAQGIMNWPLLFKATQRIYDFNLKADGTVVTLPGGDLKLAVGVANRHEHYNGQDPIGVPEMNATGPLAGVQGDYTNPNPLDASRVVNAIYGEISLPVVGAGNEFAAVHRFDVSIAGRYDHYTDFGGTSNPKYGLVWSPIEDVSLRATYGTSFHAPQLADIYGIDTRASLTLNAAPANPATFPSSTQTVINSGAPVYSISIAGGKPGLKPETAKTAAFGADIKPTALPGFKANLTYFMIRYHNEVEIPPSPAGAATFSNPAFIGQVYTFNANGTPLTPAQINAVLHGVRTTFYPGLAGILANPSTYPLYLITDRRRTNLGSTDIDGWDFDFNYKLPMFGGTFTADLSGEYQFKFQTQLAPNTPFVNNITSGLQYFQNDAGAQVIIPWHARLTTGWLQGPLSTQVAFNYTGHYNYVYSLYDYTDYPSGVNGAAPAALQWVKPFVTVDLSASWNFAQQSGLRKNASVQLNVYNLMNQAPPVELVTGASGGFATEAANPLGRTFRISVDKRW